MSDWKPKPNRSIDVRTLALSAEEGFLLSRLDGATPVSQLTALTGLPPERVQAALQRLVASGAVVSAEAAGAPAGGGVATGPRVGAPASGRPGGVAAAPAASVAPVHTDVPTDPVPPLPDDAAAAEAPADGAHEAAADAEAPADDAEAAEGADAAAADDPAVEATHRALFERTLHAQAEDVRVALAQHAGEPELSALCFDPVPAVVKALLENPHAGPVHARLVARHHRNAAGLEAVAARAQYLADAGVRRWLLRNPQLSVALLRRMLVARRLLEQHKVVNDRDVPEHTRRAARDLLRQRFTAGAASEEKVELILRTEGRALTGLIGLPLDGKSTALLCGQTFRSATLVQNVARWASAPPALIAHLLRQESVRRSPSLRQLVSRHPNAPSDARRS